MHTYSFHAYIAGHTQVLSIANPSTGGNNSTTTQNHAELLMTKLHIAILYKNNSYRTEAI